MAKTLLQKAKEISRHESTTNISSEEIELAIAWMRDEISLTQAAKARGVTSGGIVSRICLSLREAYRAGLIKVTIR